MKIIDRKIIFAHTGENPYSRNAINNYNHAPSVTLTADDKLLVAWFSAPWESHWWQQILTSSSIDGGKTWSPAEVIQDTENISDFDPAFIRDGDRTFLFYSLARWWEPHLVNEKKNFKGSFYRYSDDCGKNWSETKLLSPDKAQRSNGIKLSTGELLLGFYRFPKGGAGVLKSVDGGESWNSYGDITTPYQNGEPTIVETPSGRILMYIRTKSGHIWRSVSHDKGVSFSAAEETDIVDSFSSSNLYRLSDDRLTLTHNPCEVMRRNKLVIRVSDDEGENWGEPVLLDEIDDTFMCKDPTHIVGPDYAVSYPSVTEDKDGNLIVVWSRYKITESAHYGDILYAKLSV